MDIKKLNVYSLIGKVNSAVNKSVTFNEAIKNGIREIVNNSAFSYAVIWYADSLENPKRLNPFFWSCPIDLSSKYYDIKDELIVKTYKKQETVSIKDFSAVNNQNTLNIFDGINIKSLVTVPFSCSGQHLGVVQFIKSGEVCSDEEIDLCELLISLTELAIEDAELFSFPQREKQIIMSIRNVTKSFKSGDGLVNILKGVNFDLFKGELLCLLGESGCGKSTLLNIIGGMDFLDGGSISFMGKDVSKLNEKELTEYRRYNIGYIFQSYNLMPNLTAKQNLMLMAELVKNPMDADEALELVNLKDKKNNYPSQLSGGQQQRVSIARALIKNPQIILADEPTAALDYATSIEVLTSFESVIEKGATVIMVTHNEEIAKMANRIIRLRNGKTFETTVNNKPLKAKDLVW